MPSTRACWEDHSVQNQYVGDIGDYGKYGLLRAVAASGFRLAVNWYHVVPSDASEKTAGSKATIRRKQDDGKYISYLDEPEKYRQYDPELFDCLSGIVKENRSIDALEKSDILEALFFHDELTNADRMAWHHKALVDTADADVVFLDPDNGLETAKMRARGRKTEKHVTWQEARDYYDRGQNVILYQHRPQMMKKERCIQNILDFQQSFLKADQTLLLEFPRYTNRYFFLFCHQAQHTALETIYRSVAQTWNGFCSFIEICRP